MLKISSRRLTPNLDDAFSETGVRDGSVIIRSNAGTQRVELVAFGS